MYKNIVNDNLEIYLNYGYLMLPVNLNIIPKIKIGAQVFYSKSGYHVSLLRLRDFPESKQKEIFNFVKKYSVKLKEVTKIYRIVKEEKRQSIIVRVRLQGLKNLISDVNKHFGYSFTYPPTHITLFALKNMEGGIGVNSYSEYKKLTYKLNEKHRQLLSKSFKLI